MEQTLFFIGGLVLGTASSIGVARMQERHKVRVTILREVLPFIGYNATVIDHDDLRRVGDLVTLAVVLRRSERAKAESIFDIYEERRGLAAFPGPVWDALPPEGRKLVRDHESLMKRREKAPEELRIELTDRLRWFGKLSEVERKALK